jgi:uroporphyrinogen decarboxylase
MGILIPKFLEHYLEPQPAPPGLTSREIVKQAIEFGGPPRIPYSFLAPFGSDFFEVLYVRTLLDRPKGTSSREKGAVYYDEWGVGQKVTGRGWDHAFDHPLVDLTKLGDYRFPDLAHPTRFESYKPYLDLADRNGKYVVAYDPVMMFERMRSLLGFEALMMASYIQPRGLEALLDRLAELIVDIIEQWGRLKGIHGFMTWDDWGLQTGLQMKIETFRQFYKPRYARLVKAAHEFGMHYIWHNCGQIMDMIPDMIEIGVDVIQLDQPRLMNNRKLAETFGGRICFWNTMDIQWSADPELTDRELWNEAAEMVRVFNRIKGGFMARHYPQPKDINLSRERCRVLAEAFFENGCSLNRPGRNLWP